MAGRFPAEKHPRSALVAEPTAPALEEGPASAVRESRAALHALLAELGYDLVFRSKAWTECFARRDTERWLGVGVGEHAALDDVLAQMVPSVLGRELLAKRLARMVAAVDRVVAGGPDEILGDVHAPATEPELPAPEEPGRPSQPITDVVAPPGTDAKGATSVPTPAPGVEPGPQPGRVLSVAPPPSSAPATKTDAHAVDELRRLSTAEAEEMLAALARSLELSLPRFARLAAERQRLTLLVGICRARSIAAQTAVPHEVAPWVGRIARHATSCAKVFWCGYVPALHMTAVPADSVDLRGVSETPPRTWREAVHFAQRRLDEHVARAADAGLDDDGWADRAALLPPPGSADTELERAVAMLEAHLGPVETPSGELDVPADLDPNVLLRAARLLRWVRGGVQDDVKWGTAVGRLRRVALTVGTRGAAAREALDASFTPGAPWASLIAFRTDTEHRAGAVATLKVALPTAAESPDSFLVWLISAFDVFATPELAALLAPHRAHVSALAEGAPSMKDRRCRRRLRDLDRQLATVATPAPPEVLAPAEVDTPDDEALAGPELEALCERVRPRVRGRRVLFVTNRQDPELEARLAELLGIQLTWCEGTVRRVQAQATSITHGKYELVLCTTGFLDHGSDGSLARASKAARIPYVRVDRGRPLACVQALARTFGLLGMAPSGESSRGAETR